MTEPTTPPPEEPAADETFTRTQPSGSHESGSGGAGAGILESVRDAVDELAERAGPSVRELSARAAEIAAIAADRAAPLAKRAGEVTSDASGKLATKSREWAAELRATLPAAEPAAGSDTPLAAPSEAAEAVEVVTEPPQEPADQG